MPIRIDNPYEVGADRLVNAVAAYERVGRRLRGRRLRDQRSTSTSSPPRASIWEGASPRGWRSRSRPHRARRPHPADRPCGAGGRDRQVDPLRASSRAVVYGFAGLIDGIARRFAAELGEGDPRSSRRVASPRRSFRFCETIDEVDDLLTLTGLRIIWDRNVESGAAAPNAACNGRRRRPQGDSRNADTYEDTPADLPVSDRRRRDREPRAARAARRDRQLVRAPPGAPARRRPGRTRRWSRATRSATATSARCGRCCASIPTSTRFRSSSSAPIPT